VGLGLMAYRQGAKSTHALPPTMRIHISRPVRAICPMPYGLWPLLSPRAKCPRRGAAPAAPPQPGLRGRLGAAKAKGPKSTQCCAMIRQTACVAVVALLMASTGSAACVSWYDYSSDGCSGDTTASGCWQDGECLSTPARRLHPADIQVRSASRRVPRVLLFRSRLQWPGIQQDCLSSTREMRKIDIKRWNTPV
jgi:hypothetical protein